MAQFDWLPILEGKYLTYYQIGALIFSGIDLLFAFISLLIYLLISKVSMNYLKKKRYLNHKYTIAKDVAYFSIFLWLSFIPLVCSALDVINLIEGMLGMMTIYIISLYIHNGVATVPQSYLQEIQMRQINQSDKSQFLISNTSNNGFFQRSLRGKINKKYLIIAIILSVSLPLFFYKTCISFFNEQIGYQNKLFGPAINTYWARYLQLKRSCPPGPPCHVYATIPQDPTTAFFLNIHTHSDIKSSPIIYYQQLFTQNPNQFLNKTFQSYEYPQLQWLSSRKIHSVLINNLKANTKYLIKVKYDNQFYTNAIYKTLPSDPKIPVTMINAGDSGYTQASHNLSKLVSKYKPDIFFIGGDVAYDNNMPACAYTWDFFLGMIQGISNQIGYIMPLVLSTGNHDVGLNELSGTNISLDQTAFFKYFPQHFHRDANGTITDRVPPVNQRRSYLNFQFRNISYLALDSGYIHGFDGIQKQFIKSTFEQNKHKIKFVNYHVPIYSACQRFDKNPKRFLYALFHWVPLFDQYKVVTIYQNHVHSFKRTKPLRSNQPHQNGTVYLGDGAYGAVLQPFCKADATVDIFHVQKDSNNVWISQIRQTQVYHLAIDSHGNKLDEFTQQFKNYAI